MRLLLAGLCIFCISCGKNTVSSEEELQEYILDEDNGLIQTSSDDDLDIHIIVRPTEQLVAQELGTAPPDSLTINRLRKKFDPNLYFIMSLSKSDGEALHSIESSGGDYSELLQVLSFRMNDFVRLTTSESDTIPVADFILNRTYGFAKSTDLLFVFSREKIGNDRWVQFEFNEFGLGTGIKKYRFNMSDVKAAPTIVFR